MSDTKQAPALMDTAQAAHFLGLSRRTLENRRVTGLDAIPFFKVGRSVRYDLEEILLWLNARRFRSTSEADVARVAA